MTQTQTGTELIAVVEGEWPEKATSFIVPRRMVDIHNNYVGLTRFISGRNMAYDLARAQPGRKFMLRYTTQADVLLGVLAGFAAAHAEVSLYDENGTLISTWGNNRESVPAPAAS